MDLGCCLLGRARARDGRGCLRRGSEVDCTIREPTLQVVGFPKLYVSALLRGLSTCVVPPEMLGWYVKGSPFKEEPRPEETNRILVN